MIGDIDWLGQIVGGVADGDTTANTKIAKALIRSGLAVVLIEPGGKKAVCTLNAAEAKKANTAAQDEARAAGSTNWERVRHDCGIKHAITDEKFLNRAGVKRHLEAGANLAISPGHSSRRVIIVDVDTESERKAFLSDWSDHCGSDQSETPMTVSSPGKMNTAVDTDAGKEEIWVHKDGGHYWFDIPDDVELPERPGKLTWCRCHSVQQPTGGCLSAWCAYYGSGYVLIPPSLRPEGPYRLTGGVEPAPAWLTDLIQESRVPERDDGRTGALSSFSDDPIDVWACSTSWHTILTEDGFREHSHDTCGCPTFTRPGDATHSKSVTAHEVGCTQYDTSGGHGPLRIWSDALGSGTMSKLKYIAKFHHNGDIGAAMSALGIQSMHSDDDDDLFELGSMEDYPKDKAPKSGAADVDRFAPVDWTAEWESEFPTSFLPGMLLEHGQQVSLVGSGKVGKSILIFDWARCLTAGLPFLTDDVCEPMKILYLDKENSRKDIFTRAHAMGARLDDLVSRFVYLSFPPFKPLDGTDGAMQVMALVDKHEPNVVIIDTVGRFVEGKENEQETWQKLYRTLHVRLKARGIACIRLDHFGKDEERGARGSAAKSQDIDHVWELKADAEECANVDGGREIITYLTLQRTFTRSGLGPDRMRVRRRGVKTHDERAWISGRTSHTIADPFDNGLVELDTPRERPTALMRLVCVTLSGAENGMSQRQVLDAIRGKKDTAVYALECLVEDGYVRKEKIGRPFIYTLIKMMPEDKV